MAVPSMHVLAAKQPAVGGFSPSDSADLALWLDASDAGSFTYGTGTQVATWADLSASGYDVSRAASTSVMRSATIGGLDAVDFTADGRLERASVNLQTLFNSTDTMSFAVLEVDSTSRAVWMACIGSTYRLGLAMTGGSANYFDVGSYTGARLSGTVGYTTATPFLMTAYRNGATIKVRLNGTEVLSRTDATGTVGSETATLQVGGQSGFSWLDGRMGELVHVAGYDAGYVTDCEAYLTAKWGL